MPQYLYRNPKTSEIVEVYQSVNEPHVYESHGVKYERVFTVPQAAADTKVDPHSSKDFLNITAKKSRDRLGDLFDRSKELSEKRKDKDGLDVKQEQYFQEYESRRKGKKHPVVMQREIKNKLNSLGVNLQ